jgi:hypothetical protein
MGKEDYDPLVEDKKEAKALDEADIALLKTYVCVIDCVWCLLTYRWTGLELDLVCVWLHCPPLPLPRSLLFLLACSLPFSSAR